VQKKYTPDMIWDKLLMYGFDKYTFFKAFFMLVNNTEALKLFFGMPPKFREAWIIRKISKREGMNVSKETPNKKRKDINVEEETSNKKRKI
jgi:hypothetical protein